MSPKDPSCSGEDAVASDARSGKVLLLLIETSEGVPHQSLLEGASQ